MLCFPGTAKRKRNAKSVEESGLPGDKGEMVREARNFERISLPKSCVGQLGITRKECVKGVL